MFFFSGNVFVIAAILLQRNLQNVANYLIVSLAVADLMVACLVMPFGAIYEVSDDFYLIIYTTPISNKTESLRIICTQYLQGLHFSPIKF